MPNSLRTWYAAKSLCRWYLKESGESRCVEERLVLFKASGFDEALKLAQAEVTEYCSHDAPTANFRIEPIDWLDVYLIDEHPDEHVEVYSRLMDTTLSGDAFLRRYYPKSQDHKPPSP